MRSVLRFRRGEEAYLSIKKTEMADLLLLIVLLTLVALLVIIAIDALRRKPVKKTQLALGIIILVYATAWAFCYTRAIFTTVPLGQDICFDDWCAAVTSVDQRPHSDTILLHITMSNHARGIAQRPDQPRIHLIDDAGHRYSAIAMGGTPLDSRLELHQSLSTTMTFTVPSNVPGVGALIEEGPLIAEFAYPGNKPVFKVR